jgi:hypothetical protein
MGGGKGRISEFRLQTVRFGARPPRETPGLTSDPRTRFLPNLKVMMTFVLLSLITVLALVLIEGQNQLVGPIRA